MGIAIIQPNYRSESGTLLMGLVVYGRGLRRWVEAKLHKKHRKDRIRNLESIYHRASIASNYRLLLQNGIGREFRADKLHFGNCMDMLIFIL